MPATVNARPDSYMRCVRAFRLRSIRTDTDLAAAQHILDDLLQRQRDEGEQDYLDALSDLIEVYEGSAHPIPDSPAGDVLRMLMESNGLTQSGLADRALIAQSTLSAVLAGGRKLTAKQMVKLGRVFNVSPAVFLPRE